MTDQVVGPEDIEDDAELDDDDPAEPDEAEVDEGVAIEEDDE